MEQDNITRLADSILRLAIPAGCAHNAGRGLGLTALAKDARTAAEVLLGLRQVEGGQDYRPEGAPKLGRPRKLRVSPAAGKEEAQ